jgi:uncharacterized membrane protein
MRGYYDFYQTMPYGGAYMWLAVAFRAILFIGFIALVIWVIKRLTAKKSENIEDEAIQTVRNRYASGDLSKEQFDQLMADLSQKSKK